VAEVARNRDPLPAREKRDYSVAQKDQASSGAQQCPIRQVLAVLMLDKKRLYSVQVKWGRG